MRSNSSTFCAIRLETEEKAKCENKNTIFAQICEPEW